MKKLITLLIFMTIGIGLMAQENHPKGIYVGKKISTPAGSNIMKIDSICEINNKVYFFSGGDTIDFGSLVANQIILSTVTRLKTDTVSITVAGLGSLQKPDTNAFNNGAWAGAVQWNGPDTLNATAAVSALGSGTGTETLGYNVCFSDTLGAVVPTKLFTSDRTVTAVIPTVGDTYTTIANAKIAPGDWIWVPISGVSAGNRPGFFTVTLVGYLINGR